MKKEASEDILQHARPDREMLFSRILNAPRELVWKAWTEPKHLLHWWGPAGFTNTFHEIAIKPGGVWRFTMHGPDGTDYPNRIVYKEVIKPERLVYVHSDDKENDPNQFHVTVLLEDLGERTRLTMRAQFASAAILDRVIKEFKADVGAIQTLDRLEAELEKMNKGLQTAKYNGVK